MAPATGDSDGRWLSAAGTKRRRKNSKKRNIRPANAALTNDGGTVEPLPPRQNQSRPLRGRSSADESRARGDYSSSSNLKKVDSVSATLARRKGRKVPKSAVVCVKRDIDSPSYAQLLRSARERVNLSELGINNSKIRWSASGAILIKISGVDKTEKADLLADKLTDALRGEATISRPVNRPTVSCVSGV